MNLGQAAAVCLWELARGQRSFEEGRNRGPLRGAEGKRAGEGRRRGATMETVERITKSMLECLLRSGYVAARSEVLAEEKLRRMVRRFSLDAVDAEVFLGMVRKMEEKLKG